MTQLYSFVPIVIYTQTLLSLWTQFVLETFKGLDLKIPYILLP